MVLLTHGAAGGWDELIIAAVGLAVLWIAVKVAGRKTAETEADSEGDLGLDEPLIDAPPPHSTSAPTDREAAEHHSPQPPATRLG